MVLQQQMPGPGKGPHMLFYWITRERGSDTAVGCKDPIFHKTRSPCTEKTVKQQAAVHLLPQTFAAVIYSSSCKLSALHSASAYHPSCRGPDSEDCDFQHPAIRQRSRSCSSAVLSCCPFSGCSPSPGPAHLSSVAGSRSSARPAGTCAWSCRPEPASPGSCSEPRSRRCICHPRSERGVGSLGAHKRPLQETDATASAIREPPGCSCLLALWQLTPTQPPQRCPANSSAQHQGWAHIESRPCIASFEGTRGTDPAEGLHIAALP